MTTYNTGNPIGSTDSRDRLDNTENMDYLENSTTELTHADRLGTVRKTRHGMEVEHDAQIAAHESEHDAQMQSFENDFDGRLAGMAFTRVGSFAAGATLTDMRQVLVWEASQGGDGREYGWTGTFPKVVAAGSTPETTGGIGAGAWVDRTDVTLRSEVRETVFQNMKRLYAEAGFNLVDGSFQMGGSLSGWPDVLWDWATGVAYQWHLDEAKTVVAGSAPTNIGTDWIDKSLSTLRSEIKENNTFIDSNSSDEEINDAIASGRYIARKGSNIKSSAQLPNSYTRADRVIGGGYDFAMAGTKRQKYCYGTFENAAVASFIARDNSNIENSTQILGVTNGQALSLYDNVDTAALYIANRAQPAILKTTNTSYTATTVTSPDISSVYTDIRIDMIATATCSSVIYYGIVQSFTTNTVTVDGWYTQDTGVAVIPTAGATLKIQPTSRVWGENIVVTIPADAEASSAVGSEIMTTLYKGGSGNNTQLLKLINNNVSGIIANAAVDVIGLFTYGSRIKEGATTGYMVENPSTYGFHNISNGTAYPSTIAFKTGKVTGSAYGADVGYNAQDSNIAFQVMDALSRAFQVRQSGVERFYIAPNGQLYQTLGIAENTLAAQFGISANAGLSVYQSSGTGAASTATVRVGMISTNSRSINTAGTVNTSGADYAEYMFKRDDCGVIKKGDICGIDENGMLTDKFSLSKHFCVKSTAPSFVGGDTWFNEDEPEDIESEAHAEWEVRKEEARCKVDRIAFCGIVPINIESAKSGDYVIPVRGDNDSITAITINNPTFEQFMIKVGKVVSVSDCTKIVVSM